VSDQPSELQRRLELATAADLPPNATLDDETASLREGWLALGKLLETSQPMCGELPRLRPVRRPTDHDAFWEPTGVAMLAASLVIALTLALALIGVKAPGGLSTPPYLAVSPNVEQSLPEQAADELVWDDSLDEHLALVGREIVRIEQDWYCLDDAFYPVQFGLQQVEDDIGNNTL